MTDRGLLEELHTALATFEGNICGRISSWPGLGELRRRSFPEQLRSRTHMHPWRELVRLVALRLGWHGLVEPERGWACVDRVYDALDRATARAALEHRPQAVYCYEDGALHTFLAAKQLRTICLYDLPIGYWRAARHILTEEADRRPEWASTLGGLKDSEAKLARKDEELRLADRILVASTFTKSTLEKCPFPLAPVSVIPYGADDAAAGVKGISRRSAQEGPLRVLFVGGLSQRKGIADLFEAMRMIGAHAELTVIGRKSAEACAALDVALGKHRWIERLAREKILQEMRAHDVLVFPSLFEGFGLVVTEALSQGIPVITTPHTCGPDLLTEGEDGFIVPIRDPQAIAGKLELLHRDRSRLAAMSDAARKKAEGLMWADYRRRIVEVVENSCI